MVESQKVRIVKTQDGGRNELITQYMIVNSAFLDTRFEVHTRHTQEHTRYTSQLTAVQDAVVLELTTWITSRNEPSLKIDELVESSEDRETWRELVITCVELQPPD